MIAGPRTKASFHGKALEKVVAKLLQTMVGRTGCLVNSMCRNHFSHAQVCSFAVLLLVLSLDVGRAGGAVASTNLATVFASMGFNPFAPSSATIVQISDIHMSVTQDQLPEVVTNVDNRLVKMVNEMRPPPAKIVFTGDFSIMGSYCFGAPVYTNLCIEELQHAKRELLKFTNAPLVLMPGNHDTYGTEGDTAHLFQSVFTNTPAYGKFEVKGLKALYLYGHHSAELDPTQEAWFRNEVSQLSPHQQVAVFVHQPPLNGLTIERGLKSPLMESFREWEAPVWAFAGHYHWRDVAAFSLGKTNIYQVLVSSANRLISTSPIPTAPDTPGFQIICVRDAQVVGIIFGALTNGYYYPVNLPGWSYPVMRYMFEEVPRPLLLREEGDYDRSEYSEWCKCLFSGEMGFDTGDWWAYVHQWRVRLPLGDYRGMATHALLATESATPDTADVSLTKLRDFKFRIGVDTNNMVPTTVTLCSNHTAYIVIPPNLRSNSHVWLELTNDFSGPFWEMHIGGWGLATTNSIGWPMPPRFTAARVNPDGSRAFRLLAIPRQACRIESSSDHMHWVTNQVIPNPSGIIEWKDTATNAGPRRFYRVGQSVP